MAEYAYPALKRPEHSDLEIATLLIGQVRSSEKFICVLNGNTAGSTLAPHSSRLSSTFFELELFQAIVIGRPIYLLAHESFDSRAMGSFLDLLEFGLPGWRDAAQAPMSDRGVLRAIQSIRRGTGARWRVNRGKSLSPRLHLGLMHSRDRFVRKEATASAHFLQLNARGERADFVRPNLDAISDLIANRKSFDEELDNDRRLAFAWLLMRELVDTKLFDANGEIEERDPDVLGAWNAALKDWHGAAAWQGLHSHIFLGTIPTLNTLDSVREALRRAGRSVDPWGASTDFPRGAYSSSYYSVAKRIPTPAKNQVLQLASSVLKLGVSDADFRRNSGNYAMLGSIALEQGAVREAIEHYEAVVRLRRQDDPYARDLGEALCELAFARVLDGQKGAALRDSIDGLELLQTPDARGQLVVNGFLVRAMFKAAIIHARCARFPDALRLYRTAMGHAKDKHLDDQYQQWTVPALGRRLLVGGWKRLTDS